MDAKVDVDASDNCRIALVTGESFTMSKEELPIELQSGGNAQILVVATGEKVGDDNARNLLNHLLGE